MVNGQTTFSAEVFPGDDGPEVNATANSGYTFLHWNDSTIVNPRKEFNVQSDANYWAHFTDKAVHTLTYTATTGGSISGIAQQQVEEGGYGAKVEAVPDAGYQFVRWSDGNPSAARRDINVQENINVHAEFVATGTTIHTLGYSIEGSGRISGYAFQRVVEGDDGVEVEAIPSSNEHRFVRWLEDGLTTPKRTELNVHASIIRTAKVVPITTDIHRLSYGVRDAGTGSISGPASQQVEDGGNGLQVHPLPAGGNDFVRWSDGRTDSPRQDANVRGDVDVQAIFVPTGTAVHKLTYTADANGSISGPASQSVEEGGDGVAVEALPTGSYEFVSWSDGRIDNPRQDVQVQGDVTVEAAFVATGTPIYTLTYTADANGSISGPAKQRVAHGGDGVAVEALPTGSYEFVRWSDGRTDNPRQDADVRGDVDVQAIFVPTGTAVYTLTYTADVNGSISGPATQRVEEGGDGVAVEALAAAGYTFLHWSDSTISNARRDTDVRDDITVQAIFTDRAVYTLSYAATTGGSISGIAQQQVEQGGNGAKVEAVADAGYQFVRWSDGNPNAARWDTNVQASISVQAEFVHEGTPIYTLAYTAGTGGSISGYAVQRVAHGGDGMPVTANAAAEHFFSGWDDGLTATTRTDLNVQADIAATALFTPTYCDVFIQDTVVSTCGVFWWGDTIPYVVSDTYMIVKKKNGAYVSSHSAYCDSLYRLHLTVELQPDTAYATVLASESYEWMGRVYTASGIYDSIVHRPGHRCDSVVRLYLTIVETSIASPMATGLVSSQAERLQVQPNPTTGELWVEMPQSAAGPAELRVYNVSGQLVLRQRAASDGRTCIDMGHLPTGVYIVRSGNAVAKVVRQ